MWVWVVILALTSAVSLVEAVSYSITISDMSPEPILSSGFPNGTAGHSPCKFTFNPAFIPGSSPPGMLVRANGCPEEFGGSSEHILFAECPEKWWESGIKCKLWPSANFTYPSGSEDPRVVRDEARGRWINFWYSPLPKPAPKSCSSGLCTVAMATSTTPLNSSSWFASGPPRRFPWHRNGCMIIRDKPPHYAFYGEGPDPLPGLGVATTSDFETFTTINSTWLLPLGPGQQEIKLEMATPPVRLSTGDYLAFYAAATPGWVANGNYTAGALILDGNDPTRILKRVPHIMEPLLPYQQGLKPWPVNRARVIFLPSAVAVPGETDTFRLFFGAADASVGTAVATVTTSTA